MPDPRITQALRALEPEVPSGATEVALRDVRARADRRRRRGRVGVVIAAAAAIAVVTGTLAVLDLGDDGRRTVVVADPPTTESTATTTTTSTTVPSTATTILTETSAPGVGTFDDLAGGVTGLEVTTWWMGSDEWNGLWRADPQLANEVAAAIVDSDAAAPTELGDSADVRFELADGRVVFARVDLETGRVSRLDLDTGASLESSGMLPSELTRRLRAEFNDAVGRPWEPYDLDNPNSWLGRAISRMDLSATEPEQLRGAMAQALESLREDGYPRWFVELRDEGDGPTLEVRERGVGDDSSRGSDYRIRMVQTSTGWDVGEAEARALCTRSTPGPPPNYACL